MTHPSEEQVERVAASLSRAQRAAVLWLPEDGSPRVHDKAAPREVSFWTIARIVRGKPEREVAQLYSLCERSNGPKRRGHIWPDRQWNATPLGLAVRQFLQSKDKHSDQ